MKKRSGVKNVKYRMTFPIKLCIILAVSSVISGLIFQKFVSLSLGGSYANSRFVIKSVKDFLVPSLWFSITIFTLIFSLGTIFISILVSHRIAGPLYRLETTFRDFKDGIFYTISLRPKDQVQDFAKATNEFVESLSDNFSSAKRLSLSMNEMIESAKSKCDEDDVDYQGISEINRELKAAAEKLNTILGNYKTK